MNEGGELKSSPPFFYRLQSKYQSQINAQFAESGVQSYCPLLREHYLLCEY